MFRSGTRLFAIVVAALLVWVASHRSDEPEFLGRYSGRYFPVVVSMAAFLGAAVACTFGPGLRRAYALRWRLSLGLLAVLVLGLSLEAVVRTFDLYGVSYYAELARSHLEKVPDDELVYRLAAGLDTQYQGVTVQTNALGMRERPVAAKLEAEFRVLCLGDSVTFGWGCEESSTWCRRLEQLAAARTERPMRTLNAGVSSYDSRQELRFLQRHITDLEPDLVVLLFVENDIEIKQPPFDPNQELSLRGKTPAQTLKRLAGRSWSWRLVEHFLGARRQPVTDPLKLEAGIQEALRSVQEMARQCHQNGAPLAVFLYRTTANQLNERLAMELAASSAAADYLFQDTLSWFQDETPASFTLSVIDAHPNPQGHALVARKIHATLAEHELLPR